MTKAEFLDGLGKVYEPVPYSGCWIWMMSTVCGYGSVKYDGKTERAHRLMYQLTKGPIPQDMLVCHKCDTKSCVNPEHLFLGSQKDNISDCLSKQRFAVGSRQGSSKLTDEKVRRMRALKKEGYSDGELGKIFGVNQTTVSRIIRRKYWAWLDDIAALKGDE